MHDLDKIAAGLAAGAFVAGTGGLALFAAGYAGAGVAAGSLAASLQGPAVAAGSWFATCQSLGATGALGAVAAKTGVASASTYLGGKVWRRGPGVTARSVATGLKGPAVSCFSTCQSLGAKGAQGAVAAKTGVARATTYLGRKVWGRR